MLVGSRAIPDVVALVNIRMIIPGNEPFRYVSHLFLSFFRSVLSLPFVRKEQKEI